MTNNFRGDLYSITECYKITYYAFRSIPHLIKAKKKYGMSQEFSERIMLAVTEVNQCSICSYGHTKMALEAGVPENEIKDLLAGNFENLPKEEIEALLFAQHYADTRANPSLNTWKQIVKKYELGPAKGILGNIRMIMWGNAYGIASSSFINRFKGEADKRSSLLYELIIMLSLIIFLPIAILNALIFGIIRIPYVRFKKQNI